MTESAGSTIRFSSLLKVLCRIVFALNVLVFFSFFQPGLFWWLDFIQFFQWQLALLAVLGFLICILSRSRLLGILHLILCLFYFFRLVPFDDSKVLERNESLSKPPLLLSFNLQSENRKRSEFLKLIQEKQPQVIFLYEVTHGWKWYLERRLSKSLYPYQYFYPQSGEQGVALLSRIPLAAAGVWFFDDRTPFLYAELEAQSEQWAQDENLFMIGLRLPKHFDGFDQVYQKHEVYFSELNRLALSLNGPLILVGDLNQTPYSPLVSKFQFYLKLVDLTPKFPPFFTWPTDFWPLSAQLDHVFVSESAADLFFEAEKGPSIGSDHFPVFVYSK